MISRGRKTLYLGTMLLVLCLFVECLSLAAYGVATGRLLSFAEAEAERQRVREGDEAGLVENADRGPVSPWHVLHPYLGFVTQPTGFKGGSNGYGFMGKPPPFRIGQRGDGSNSPSRTAVVAIFGGSVASLLPVALDHLIGTELEGKSCFKGRKVRVINLALPGVKQPQQLMTLEYFLSVGAVIDVVITLDGFNEVVLPIAENKKHGVFPFYPRNWKFFVAGLKDVRLMREIGEVEFWRSQRKQLATVFSGFPLRYSATANTLWFYVDRALGSSISLKMVDLTLSQIEEGSDAGGYIVHGPGRRYKSERENYDDLVAVWSRSMELMHEASSAAGIASFHFLQPNQRVPGSKIFAEGEREIAIPERHGYDQPTRKGYPLLIEEGKRMRTLGFPFDDLTMVFKDVAEPLYIDGCCHVNARGSELMIREMARIIHKRFEQGQPCPAFD
jgi:hypothetical protein